MWSYHEKRTPGFSRSDVHSWDLIKAAKTYGLPPEPAIFSPQILRNRQNPNVCRAFGAVLGVSNEELSLRSPDYSTLRSHTSKPMSLRNGVGEAV